MKKILSVVLVLMLSLVLFSGCGKTEATKNTEALIKAIGNVNTDSESAINDARSAFDALSEEEQAKVKNIEVLQNAESAYTDIVTVNEDIAAIVDAAENGYSSEEVKISELLTKAKAIKESYAAMSEERKAQVTGYENVDTAIEKLESYTKNAEIAAAAYIKAFLQSFDVQQSQITAIYCIKQIRNETDEYHFFALSYKDKNDEETTVYSHARCTAEVTAEAIAERAETFFADAPAVESADARENGNVTLDLASVLALIQA